MLHWPVKWNRGVRRDAGRSIGIALTAARGEDAARENNGGDGYTNVPAKNGRPQGTVVATTSNAPPPGIPSAS
jgi:hypothetical protein